MGRKQIPGIVFADEALDAELAQIDENLIRAELTVIERGDHLVRRKEIYEARHPETKAGVAGAHASNKAQGKEPGIFLWDYADLLRKTRWAIIRQIQCPLSTQQVHPDIINKFREQKRLARLGRYLLIAES